MKTKIVILTFAVTGLLIYLLSKSDFDSLTYKVFSAHSKDHYLYKKLGIIPSEYINRYRVKIIEQYNGKELLNIFDKLGSNDANFIVIKENKAIVFLKSYKYMYAPGVPDTASFKYHVSSLINLEAFNSYVVDHGLDKKSAIQKYFYFLTAGDASNSFKIIKSKGDINEIVREHPNSSSYTNQLKDIHGKNIYNIITADDISFSETPNAVIYCWFINKGVVKFEFEFKIDNTVSSVRSEIVGFLGIEVPSV